MAVITVQLPDTQQRECFFHIHMPKLLSAHSIVGSSADLPDEQCASLSPTSGDGLGFSPIKKLVITL